MNNWPSEFFQAIDQFNQGEYYACHDTLEALWMEAMEPERTLYQGLLQIAVAGYHLGNGNQRGAVLLLGEGLMRLRRCPELPNDWDFTGLITQGSILLQKLQAQENPKFNLRLAILSQ
jgi:predicted metal-dependent hydrolase